MKIAISRRDLVLGVCLTGLAWGGLAQAKPVTFNVQLSGAQQVPPLNVSSTGEAAITWDAASRGVSWAITYSGTTTPVTMAHFHLGAKGKNGPVEIWLTKRGSPVKSPIEGSATLSPEQAKAFEAGDFYINVHTQAHPAGELRGQVEPPKM
jgi:CHRD domain